ncbi:hypothetical protein MKW94_026166 [Papaver nudicaule]|uniref:Non-structural maintenance of chromosomes element 1 homolog n=1 Tax=Papaver nudicaule TaxID=74823 RepID=A0AA41S4M3_PAPNU|nr:hypothetical protein [Papaver nudicaule]
MPDLSWRHHALIQTLLSRGPLKEEEFNSLFAVVSGKPQGTNKKEFSDYLLKINKELAFVQFELRGCRNQYDGKVYYGVVNNVADEQAKFGTKYTVPQIAFYKGIIEAIAQDTTASGCISNIDALNIRLENQSGIGSQSPSGTSTVPYAFRNFTISQKDKTIDELVQDRWLCAISDGKIGLGIRSFLDLRSWFRGNDVASCEICNEAGVKAELCQNEDCKMRIHHYCLKKKFSQRMAEKVCPSCGTEWPSGSTFEAAKEDEGEEEDQGEPSQYQAAQPSSTGMRKKRRSVKSERSDTVGEGRHETSEPVRELRRTTRSATQRR